MENVNCLDSNKWYWIKIDKIFAEILPVNRFGWTGIKPKNDRIKRKRCGRLKTERKKDLRSGRRKYEEEQRGGGSVGEGGGRRGGGDEFKEWIRERDEENERRRKKEKNEN